MGVAGRPGDRARRGIDAGHVERDGTPRAGEEGAATSAGGDKDGCRRIVGAVQDAGRGLAAGPGFCRAGVQANTNALEPRSRGEFLTSLDMINRGRWILLFLLLII